MGLSVMGGPVEAITKPINRFQKVEGDRRATARRKPGSTSGPQGLTLEVRFDRPEAIALRRAGDLEQIYGK